MDQVKDDADNILRCLSSNRKSWEFDAENVYAVTVWDQVSGIEVSYFSNKRCLSF